MTYLVTGGTGNVGKVVTGRLVELGDTPVRIVTRDASKIDNRHGIEVSEVDLQDVSDYSSVLDGVTAVFLNTDATGHRTSEFITAAAESGVDHVVMLSSSYLEDGVPAERQSGVVAQTHRRNEEFLVSSGLSWTIVRAEDFATNARWQHFPQMASGDKIYGPYPQAGSATVHETDLGEVVATIISDGSSNHERKIYHVSGPETTTEKGRVRMTAEVTGRDLEFVEVSRDQAESTMAEQVGREVAHAVLDELEQRVATPATPTTTVRKILGRDPLSYKQWLQDHLDEIP